jgi:MSHA biogenesis protein MshL
MKTISIIICMILCTSCVNDLRTKEFESNQVNSKNFKDYSQANINPDLIDTTNILLPKEKTADIEFKDLKLSMMCKLLSKIFNESIALDQEQNRDITISISLKNATIKNILDYLLQMYNIGHERINNNIIIYQATTKTKIFNLNYHNLERTSLTSTTINAFSKQENNSQNKNISNIETKTANEYWKNIEKVIKHIISVKDISQANNVEILRESSLIIVTTDPRTMNIVEKFISKINKQSSQQVVIEVKILEVALNDQYKNGLRMDLIGRNNGNGFIAGNSLIDSLAAIPTTSASTTSESLPALFKALYKKGDFTGIIEALSVQGKVSVLSSPTINVLNNHRSIIKYGEDRRFVSDVTNVTLNNANNTQTQSGFDFETFFSGIALDTTPSILEGDKLILHIKPIINRVTSEDTKITVDDKKTTIPMAVVQSREADTVIAAKSGQIIIVGGITEDTVSSQSSNPFHINNNFLSKILSPLSGKSSSVVKKEILILLKPTIIEHLESDIL